MKCHGCLTVDILIYLMLRKYLKKYSLWNHHTCGEPMFPTNLYTMICPIFIKIPDYTTNKITSLRTRKILAFNPQTLTPTDKNDSTVD